MNRKLTTLGAAAAQPSSNLPAEAVAILKKTGVNTGAVYGDRDIYGDGLAQGQYPNLEQVTVYTFADQAAMNTFEAAYQGGFAPTDSNQWVTGSSNGTRFGVEVTGVDDVNTNGTDYPTPVKVIAARVSGTVVTS